MEVYVLIAGQRYEYNTILGVYSTLELARDAEVTHRCSDNKCEEYDIYKQQIDAPPFADWGGTNTM